MTLPAWTMALVRLGSALRRWARAIHRRPQRLEAGAVGVPLGDLEHRLDQGVLPQVRLQAELDQPAGYPDGDPGVDDAAGLVALAVHRQRVADNRPAAAVGRTAPLAGPRTME